MFIEQLSKDPQYFFAMVIAIVVSVCLHELAHGFAAIWLGDRTPIERGHITLNPLVHMGWMSLVAMLVAGIAWGAMPVDRRRLRGKYASAIVSAAGPATNILIAAIALGTLGLWERFDDSAYGDLSRIASNARFLLWIFGVANVLLAMFNLLPVPPLDGSGILRGLSPAYSNLMDRVMQQSGGAYLQIALLVFVFGGKYISQFAGQVARFILIHIRGG
jgi:Zn-dependent protease